MNIILNIIVKIGHIMFDIIISNLCQKGWDWTMEWLDSFTSKIKATA